LHLSLTRTLMLLVKKSFSYKLNLLLIIFISTNLIKKTYNTFHIH